MRTTSLAWRLLAAGGRRGMLSSILTLAAVTLVTALLMFAVAANIAFEQRGERTAWRIPEKASDDASAIEASGVDHVKGEEFTQVDLAATGSGQPPAPPGMDHFPKPGEVWLSPALAKLTAHLPQEEFGDRFDSTSTGTLKSEALVHDNDLVAVVGHARDADAVTAPRAGVDTSPTPIDHFSTQGSSDTYRLYQALMTVATVLMVVPLLVFGGAAARLTVARRDQRLATLRLAGASSGQILTMTVFEAMITAAIGAVIGIAGYLAATPLVSHIRIDGGSWYVADLWPGYLATALVLIGVPILVGLSAIVGLRRVVVSPLGVARRTTPPKIRAFRFLALVVLILAFMTTASGLYGNSGAIAGLVLLVLLAATFLAMNYVGPWIVSLIGHATTVMARRASTLIAGRRLIDDPRSAWRTVAGVALTGFVAGFIALLIPATFQSNDSDHATLVMTVADTQAKQVVHDTKDTLGNDVAVKSSASAYSDGFRDITVTGDKQSNTDELRTTLSRLSADHQVTAQGDETAESNRTATDIQTGTTVVLAVSVLIAMVSSGIAAASSVLDRRQTYALLHLSGTPIRVLNAARRTETLIPLLVMGGGSTAVGLLLGSPFANFAQLNTSVMILASMIVMAVAGILGAGALSRPLLRSVMVNATPRPD